MTEPKPDSFRMSEACLAFVTDADVLTARIIVPRFGHEAGPQAARDLTRMLDRLPDPPRFVVLDFTDVEFISSAGLGSCLTMHQAVKGCGATIVVTGLREELRAVMEITRMDGLLNVVEGPEELASMLA